MKNEISVLIISDDSYIRKLYEIICDGFNISCSSAISIEAAKVELGNYVPAFIILDDSLPKGNVFPFVEYINTKFPCIKILLSAEYDMVFQMKGGNKVIYEIIEKPFKVEELQIIIDGLTQIPKCNNKENCFNQNCSRLVHV